MKELICKLTSIRKFGNKKTFTVDKTFTSIKSGQLFLVNNPNSDSKIIPVYVFSHFKEVYYSFPSEAYWNIGDFLHFHGPIGPGFSDLSKFSNILMISLDTEHSSLNALIEIGIKNGKNIAYFVENKEFPISPMVEIITKDMIEETIEWANYIAIELKREELSNNNELLKKIRKKAATCELLIYCPILCSGRADCLICSLKTKQGWTKTCQEGQIFNLDDLEIE